MLPFAAGSVAAMEDGRGQLSNGINRLPTFNIDVGI